MAFSLFPASITFRYHNNFAPHLMTIPLRTWSAPSSGHDAGTVLAWDSTQKDVEDMVSDFLTAMFPFFYTDTHFDSYVIDTYADENAPARPQVEISITGGVGTGDAYDPGAQATFMFRTADFSYLRLTMLDVRAGAQYLPVSAFPSPAYDNALALEAQITNISNGWSGRDNSRPSFLKKITYTLNEKLRKEYHLT